MTSATFRKDSALNELFAIKSDALRDRLTLSVAVFCVIAIAFGGGGSRFAIAEMLVQLAALPALYFAIFSNHSSRANLATSGDMRLMEWLLIIIVAMVGLQLIPLPAFVWQWLPGRSEMAEAAALIGQGDSWRPLSIDPQRTVTSALYLIVPATGFLAIARLGRDSQRLVLVIILCAGTLHLGAAAVQAFSGGTSFYPYSTTHKGLPIGLFANRNHTALLLLMAIIMTPPLLCGRLSSARAGRLLIFAGLAIILAFAILATRSRAVTALLPMALLILAALGIPTAYRRIGLIILGGVTSLFAALLAIAVSTGNIGTLQGLADRFQQDDDHRFEFWPDTLAAIGRYFPFGSGTGTFDPAFRAQESLDIVGTHYVNHAHNDYIEIAIETGLPGLLILAALLVLTGRQVVRIISAYRAGTMDPLPLHAALALAMLALHSLVDYPGRTLAIAAFAGALLAIIFSLEKYRLTASETGGEPNNRDREQTIGKSGQIAFRRKA